MGEEAELNELERLIDGCNSSQTSERASADPQGDIKVIQTGLLDADQIRIIHGGDDIQHCPDELMGSMHDPFPFKLDADVPLFLSDPIYSGLESEEQFMSTVNKVMYECPLAACEYALNVDQDYISARNLKAINDHEIQLSMEKVDITEDNMLSKLKHPTNPTSTSNFVRGSASNPTFKPGGLSTTTQKDEKNSPASESEYHSNKYIQASLIGVRDFITKSSCTNLFAKIPNFSQVGITEDDVNLTALLYGAPQKTPALKTDEIIEEKTLTRKCAACTFKNSISLSECEMCGKSMVHVVEASVTSPVSTPPQQEETPPVVALSKEERMQRLADINSMLNEHEEHDDSGQVFITSSAIQLEKKVDGVQREATPREEDEWAVTTPLNVRNFHQLIPNPAIKYPFELDDFQKQAVLRLERNEDIFVAAHTSAGKTVVAEYAIALAMEHYTRVVYTSPIKALSNQKYRDFVTKFGKDQVGLITGDVSINPDAACLVMTTEILRSMLYHGADIIRDIEWVIFDEVHYINDIKRGVVWEEVIIMLPEHVNMVFLSATTPNTKEFSAWIGRTKQRKVYIIYTEQRPIPLEHFLYAEGHMFKIMGNDKKFLSDGYQACSKALRHVDESDPKAKQQASAGRRQQQMRQQRWTHNYKSTNRKSEKSHWLHMIRDLEKRDLLPVVVFSFSKKKCEERANALAASLDMIDQADKSRVHVVIAGALSRLQGSDKNLPQVLRVSNMLSRGVAVHHGGLLPILKEVVEILFSKGLCKVLFATETFAMGVNMPTRTVIFNGLRKHDGRVFRDLLPGEYVQMAGRAGRRGLDATGTVLINVANDEPPPLEVLHSMLTGTATKLSSQFRLTYSMILNLLRIAEMSVSEMIKRSFSEFASQTMLGVKDISVTLKARETKLEELRQMLHVNQPCIEDTHNTCSITTYVSLAQQCSSANTELLNELLAGVHGRKCTNAVLKCNDLVLLTCKGLVYAPALMFGSFRVPKAAYESSFLSGSSKKQEDTSHLVCLVICPASFQLPADGVSFEQLPALATLQLSKYELAGHDDSDEDDFKYVSKSMRQAELQEKLLLNIHELPDIVYGRMQDDDETLFAIMKVQTSDISMLTSLSSKVIQDRLLQEIFVKYEGASVSKVVTSLASIITKYNNGFDLVKHPIDPVKEFKINDINFVERWRSMSKCQAELALYSCHTCSMLRERYHTVQRTNALESKLDVLKAALNDSSLELFPDFQARISVLRDLDYISKEDHSVKLRGRIACEINTCEELVLAEFILENIFDQLHPSEAVAALSALVFQTKCEDEPVLTPNLQAAQVKMMTVVSNLSQIQLQYQVEIEPDWIADTVNFGLMEVVYEWARGRPFMEICDLTSVEEGQIVRCITRLEETCREVRKIAQIIGDPVLLQMMEKCSELIKRDIIFASSLHVT